MSRPPRALGLMVCQGLEVGPGMTGFTLRSLIRSLYVSDWTMPVPPFSACIILHGGQGDGVLELRISHLESEQAVHRLRRWFVASSQVQMLLYQFILRDCIFPYQGRYRFALRFEGEELAEALVDVYGKESEP